MNVFLVQSGFWTEGSNLIKIFADEEDALRYCFKRFGIKNMQRKNLHKIKNFRCAWHNKKRWVLLTQHKLIKNRRLKEMTSGKEDKVEKKFGETWKNKEKLSVSNLGNLNIVNEESSFPMVIVFSNGDKKAVIDFSGDKVVYKGDLPVDKSAKMFFEGLLYYFNRYKISGR